MALLWLEGFDNYGPVGMTNTALEDAIQLRCPNSLVYSSEAGETSILADGYGYGLGLQLGQSNRDLKLTVDIPDNTSAQLALGCAFKTAVSGSQYDLLTTSIFQLVSSNGVENWLQISASGMVSAWQGSGNLLGYASKTLVPSTWYYIEYNIDCSIVDDEGAVEIRINGEIVLSAPGAGGGTVMSLNAITAINIQGQKTEGDYRREAIDDLYIADELTFLGPLKVETLRPSADVVTDWDPAGTHFDILNQTPVNAANYISSNTANASDLYDFDDLPSTVVSIQGIQIEVQAQLDANGSEDFRVQCDSNGSLVSNTFNLLTSDSLPCSIILENDPDTGTAWLPSAIDTLQAGVNYGN
jgi:hypothetical protein